MKTRSIQELAETYLKTESERDFVNLYERIRPGLLNHCRNIVSDPDIAEDALSKRRIFTDRLLELIKTNELNGGLTEPDANEFVLEAMKTFKWQKKAAVSFGDYEKLLDADALLADISGFLNPHINHLTPRVLDIDLLYQKMKEKGVKMISAIQGPPAMAADPLLRQTSFQALVEDTMFIGVDGTLKPGKHRARFGEVEQRGVALKPKGREIYDEYIDKVRAKAKQTDPNYKEVLEAEFKSFPSTYEELRKKGLAYFRYVPTGKTSDEQGKVSLDDLISKGIVRAEPIIYEDFLPVSAAGIFRSNLVDGGSAEISKEQSDKRAMLEAAIGKKIINAFDLYAAIEAKSIEKAYKAIGAIMPDDLAKKVLPAVRADPVTAKKTLERKNKVNNG